MTQNNVLEKLPGKAWIATLLLALGLVSLALLPAGCGGNTIQPDDKPKIAGILLQEDQFYRLIEYGMEAAAEQHGVDLLLGNSFGSLDKEISLIDTYISRGVSAILVAPLSVKASIPTLKRAHDEGIPVITYDGYIEADFPRSDIMSDQVALGRSTGKVAVEYIRQNLGGKAKLALIEYISLAPEQGGRRVRGFREEIDKLPGVEIVAEQDAWLAPQAADVVERILTGHPDVQIIWAANEGGTVGAVTAVRSSGKTGQVVVFGTDMSEQLADFLLTEDNILQAVTGQKPYDIGFSTVAAAVKALKGEDVEKHVALAGILFTRQRPEEVEEYKKVLQRLSQ